MHLKRLVTCVVAASLPLSPAIAADWKYLTSGTTGVEIYVDVASVRELPAIQIRRPFMVRQVWVNWDFSQDKTLKHRERRSLERYDCNSETGMTGSSTTYDPNGTVINTWAEEDYDFKYDPVTPGTVGYTIMEFVCGRGSIPEWAR